MDKQNSDNTSTCRSPGSVDCGRVKVQSVGSVESCGDDKAAEDDRTVAQLRNRANDLFKESRFSEAADLYRQARQIMRTPGKEVPTDIRQAVLMNLALCLGRTGGDPEHIVSLCDEVLSVNPNSAKAFFKRGLAYSSIAGQKEGEERQVALQLGRQDLIQAARLEPNDRHIRKKLSEVTEAMCAAGSSKKGLYDEMPPAAPRPPPQVCPDCGHQGHPCCGKAYWVRQRAEWLSCAESEIDQEPADFEDSGSLQLTRGAQLPREQGATSNFADAFLAEEFVQPGVPELTSDEWEVLEDCLESTEKPYPLDRKSVV